LWRIPSVTDYAYFFSTFLRRSVTIEAQYFSQEALPQDAQDFCPIYFSTSLGCKLGSENS
jgi:hypothetical protein